MCWALHSFHPPSTSKTAFLWHHVPQAHESISRVPDSCGEDQMAKVGDETLPCPYTPPCVTFALLLGSPPCSPCTSLRGDVTVEPTLSSASQQPKQGCPRRPLRATLLQCGLARPAAEGRKSALVKHRVWSVATSTKHQVALLFRQVLSLRRCRGLG